MKTSKTPDLSFAMCPKCKKGAATTTAVKEMFGLRTMKSPPRKDGAVVTTIRVQSQCKACRNKSAKPAMDPVMTAVAATPPFDMNIFGIEMVSAIEAPKMLTETSSMAPEGPKDESAVVAAVNAPAPTRTLTERVLGLLANASIPMTTNDIQKTLGSSGPSTRSCVSRLLEQGKAKLADPTSKIRQVVLA